MVENPFSVRCIRPGEIPYLFSSADQATDPNRLDELLDLWKANRYIGQIVGNHGCGKTTLALAMAKRAMESSRHGFESATLLTIRAKSLDQSHSPLSWLTRLPGLCSTEVSVAAAIAPVGSRSSFDGRSANKILIVDGVERLTLIQQAAMLHSLKRRQVPTLLTTHRISRRLRIFGNACPVLFRANSDMQVFTKIVSSMTEAHEPIEQAVVEDAFRSCHGNVREALMRLYDAIESREQA